ncbi:hypothetical protein [Providencia phage PSTCR2]|uniref:Uncharacterized protein n=1 Tax=Providencia phage PSTCR2 TaxID=2783544 RepID=A0A873WH85_9CAUD|nr:hypothetical protein [Providencia phage PSTCR2]
MYTLMSYLLSFKAMSISKTSGHKLMVYNYELVMVYECWL